MDLTADDRSLGGASLWHDIYPLIRACNVAELDRRGVMIYVGRWQAARGRAAWAGLVKRCEVLR